MPDPVLPPTLGWRVARFMGGGLLALALLWALGAVRYSGLMPPPGPLILALLVGLAFLVAWFRLPDPRRLKLGALVFVVLVIGLWQLKRPRTDRDWEPDMAAQPVIEVTGSRVSIQGVRDIHYPSAHEFDIHTVDRVFDLDKLRTVDFMVERFSSLDGLAHTLLTFGFEGGEFVAISVELRREAGESFNPVAGIYRQYELMYVIGTERDLIALRTNVRKSRVWLFPIRATPTRLRQLFVNMLARAAALQKAPEFYNTLTNSCTTNIVDHVHQLVPGRVPASLRIALPGYAGSLAYELGLIDTDLSFEEAEVHYRIDEKGQAGGDGPGYSERIRAGR